MTRAPRGSSATGGRAVPVPKLKYVQILDNDRPAEPAKRKSLREILNDRKQSSPQHNPQ